MSPRDDALLGIDLGGTGTRIVLMDAGGAVVADTSVPTATADPVPELLASIEATVDRPFSCIGIGASGPVDIDGVIQNPESLPAFTGIDLIGALTRRFGVPVVIDNDAATAARAESELGAGRGHDRVLMVTLGTGVGVALTDRGRPWRTAGGIHPEAGHLTVSGSAGCYCGRHSCWEQRASRTALQRAAGDLGLDLAGLADQARQGDHSARVVEAVYGFAVAEGLADLLAVTGPDVVVIGGGGAVHFDLFADALLSGLDQVRNGSPVPPIRVAELGDLAGAVGAALVAHDAGT